MHCVCVCGHFSGGLNIAFRHGFHQPIYLFFVFFCFLFFVLCCFFFYFFIIAGWAPKGELCSALCFQQNEQRQHVLCMLNCFLFSLLAFFKNSLFFRCILAISLGWPGYLTFVVAAMGILFSVVFFFLRRSVWPFMKSAKSRWTLPPYFFCSPGFLGLRQLSNISSC